MMGMEVDAFLEHIAQERDPDTLKTYRSLLKPFSEWLAGRKLIPPLIHEYIDDKKWKPKSKNDFLAAMKSYANWRLLRIPPGVSPEELRAAFEEQQRLNQIKAMSRFKIPRLLIQKGFTLEELTHLITVAQAQDAAYMYLLAYFGLRKGELNLIRDIDFGRGRLVVMTEKAKETVGERPLYFNQQCAEVLKKAQGSGWLNFQFSSSFLNDRFRKYRFVIKDSPVRPHAFRYTFNTHMRTKLKDPTLLKALMGHTTKMDMTDYYTDIYEEQIRRAMTDLHYFNDLQISTAHIIR